MKKSKTMNELYWLAEDLDEPEKVIEFHRNYVNLDLLSQNQSGSAIYKAIYNLFILNEARG
ncbi:MAG: hypothetical protein ACJA1N_000938 [Saprospiraceae bacterium]|jgi:hypothetical protein